MELIVAMREDGLIGEENDMIYHIKRDLAFFKKTTMGKTCVMGRKTYESLPKTKLPNRKIIILSRDKNYKPLYNEEVIVNYHEIASREDIIICGGKEIYQLFLPMCKTRYITIIKDKNPLQYPRGTYLYRAEYETGKELFLDTFTDNDLEVTIKKYTEKMYGN